MSVNALQRYINNDTLRKTVPQIFNQYDRDRNKYLDKYEFRNLVKGCVAKLFKPVVTDSKCDSYFNNLSTNGKITLDDISSYISNNYNISYTNLKNDSLNTAINKAKTKKTETEYEHMKPGVAAQRAICAVASTTFQRVCDWLGF